MISNYRQKGFTIVELLIVIVVIGILAAITIVAYNGIQQRGRDANRNSDMKAFTTAIELYKADIGNYPPCGSDNGGCNAVNLATPLASYMKTIPLDPLNPTRTYSYVRGTVAQDSYGLLAQYESKPTCKIGVNITMSWWASAPIC